jgi:integral membrane protein
MDSRKIALIVYRIFAWVTGVGLVLLCVFWGRELVLQYVLSESNDVVEAAHKPVAIIGMCHGFLYMFYVLCTLVLAERCRWKPVRALIIAAAGTIPFASFFAERKVTKLVRERMDSLAAASA